MKEQYDFGERKPLKENRIITDDFTGVVNGYDFLEEYMMDLAKGVNAIARSSYARNMARGAGAGAIVGGVGNTLNNMTKRDDDPTKRGLVGSFMSGAKKGAGAGAVAGGAARFVTGRSFVKPYIGKLNLAAAKDAAVKELGSGATAGQVATKMGENLRTLGNEARTAGASGLEYNLKLGRNNRWYGFGGYRNVETGWKNISDVTK